MYNERISPQTLILIKLLYIGVSLPTHVIYLSTVEDWTFGSSPHPRKCSLTHLQGPNERKPSIPEGIE